MGDDEEGALQNEIEILATIDHPNVVKQFEIFDEKHVMYLVLEIMAGGEVRKCVTVPAVRPNC
jgi:serine/threonine protein kinase